MQRFDEACGFFPPAMHHYFLELWQRPAQWFEARTCYTRSTAAASMVGYIIGLGDRHGGNILLDNTSAEVVHIDLGIAFEQVCDTKLQRGSSTGRNVVGYDG